MTFGAWLTLWYETYKLPNLARYSVRNIEQMIRLHTPAWLKDMEMRDIKTIDIDKALSLIPLGRTRLYARQVWNAAFKKAVSLEYAEKNVVDLSEKVRYRKKKSRALTISEQDKFLSALEKSRYKYLMLFYIHTGVRRNEALSILWSDIDFSNSLIRIRGTKTEESDRFIISTVAVKEILQERKKQVPCSKSSDRVFPYRDETVSREFKKICPEHHLHELRHTFITRCAECGVDMSVCQQLVGHSTIDMTLSVYNHVIDQFKRKEALKFTLNPQY